MTKEEFITAVQDGLTYSGALPTVVPTKEIERIIKNSASWFYQNYGPAVENFNYVIQKSQFNNPQFKASRQLVLPSCVISVVEFKEINGVGRLGNIDRDFSEDRLLASEIFISSFHGDDLVMRTAQYQYFDLARAFFLEHIAYDWNRNTKKIKILGRDPKFDVFVGAYVEIPLDKLFEDIYFLEWVIAHAKVSMASIIGTYAMNLPGGVQINHDNIKSEGQEKITELKETINNENQPDWFLIFH